jgi:type VI secretion system protein ImpM
MGPGFFGKLRSHGDFVSRRLPPAMQQPFDAWLQACLVRSRADLGAGWLPAYLSSPLWRFVLAPGVCGPRAWAGVMMPSADRVGRCFPLVLAVVLDGALSLTYCVHADWFIALEELALSTLDDGFAIDRFDAALGELAGAPVAAPAGTHPCIAPVAGARDDPALGDTNLAGCSAWWTDGSARVAPSLAVCPGLPPAAGFAALMDGQWGLRGWQTV